MTVYVLLSLYDHGLQDAVTTVLGVYSSKSSANFEIKRDIEFYQSRGYYDSCVYDYEIVGSVVTD